MVSGAILVAFVSSLLSYFNALEEVKENSYSIVEQLVTTTKKTASIAAYIEDKELAKEIVDGLVTNVLISAVTLKSEHGLNITNGMLGAELIVISLDHPFINDSPIGELIIYPNSFYIQNQAQVAAKKQALILIVHSFIIALFVSIVVHRLLTKPLQRLTKAFEKVNPSRPETMTMPRYDKNDEIGLMTLGINSQLKQLQLYISNEKKLSEKTQALERKFRLIFERASAGICLIDEDNKLVTTNPAFDSMLLNGQSSLEDELPVFFENPYDVIYYLNQIRNNKSINNFAVDLKRKRVGSSDSGWIQCLFSIVRDERESDRDDKRVLVEVIMHDVTERTERELRTRFEADHDPLTHLKNRRAGERNLANLLTESIVQDEVMVLMMIDLDKFKPVNDIYGHDAGDLVLIEVSRRMMTIFDQVNDICVRWGGDEFVVARSFKRFDEESIQQIAQALLNQIRLPIMLLDSISCNIGASIGIVMAPHHGINMTELLANADSTMYRVKELGRDRYEIYDSLLDFTKQSES